MKEYAVVFEKSPSGWGAYSLDLPGPGAAGTTFEEVDELVRQGIRSHTDCLIETGKAVSEPTARVALVSAAA